MLDYIWNAAQRKPVAIEIPEELRGDLIHWCGCFEWAVNYRIERSVCVNCGLVIRYVGTQEEVSKGLNKLFGVDDG